MGSIPTTLVQLNYEGAYQMEDGAVELPTGSISTRDGNIEYPDRTLAKLDGNLEYLDDDRSFPLVDLLAANKQEGWIKLPDFCCVNKEGVVLYPSGSRSTAHGLLLMPNENTTDPEWAFPFQRKACRLNGNTKKSSGRKGTPDGTPSRLLMFPLSPMSPTSPTNLFSRPAPPPSDDV
jgi:hypothetical protein